MSNITNYYHQINDFYSSKINGANDASKPADAKPASDADDASNVQQANEPSDVDITALRTFEEILAKFSEDGSYTDDDYKTLMELLPKVNGKILEQEPVPGSNRGQTIGEKIKFQYKDSNGVIVTVSFQRIWSEDKIRPDYQQMYNLLNNGILDFLKGNITGYEFDDQINYLSIGNKVFKYEDVCVVTFNFNGDYYKLECPDVRENKNNLTGAEEYLICAEDYEKLSKDAKTYYKPNAWINDKPSHYVPDTTKWPEGRGYSSGDIETYLAEEPVVEPPVKEEPEVKEPTDDELLQPYRERLQKYDFEEEVKGYIIIELEDAIKKNKDNENLDEILEQTFAEQIKEYRNEIKYDVEGTQYSVDNIADAYKIKLKDYTGSEEIHEKIIKELETEKDTYFNTIGNQELKEHLDKTFANLVKKYNLDNLNEIPDAINALIEKYIKGNISAYEFIHSKDIEKYTTNPQFNYSDGIGTVTFTYKDQQYKLECLEQAARDGKTGLGGVELGIISKDEYDDLPKGDKAYYRETAWQDGKPISYVYSDTKVTSGGQDTVNTSGGQGADNTSGGQGTGGAKGGQGNGTPVGGGEGTVINPGEGTPGEETPKSVVANVINSFISGNMTGYEIYTALAEYGIKANYSYDKNDLCTVEFTYGKETYLLVCSKARDGRTDDIETVGQSGFAEMTENERKFYKPVEIHNGVPVTYAPDESKWPEGIGQTLENLRDDYLGKLTEEELEKLKNIETPSGNPYDPQNIVNNLIKGFIDGDYSGYEMVNNLSNYAQDCNFAYSDGVCTVTFTYEGEKYKLQCSETAARDGKSGLNGVSLGAIKADSRDYKTLSEVGKTYFKAAAWIGEEAVYYVPDESKWPSGYDKTPDEIEKYIKEKQTTLLSKFKDSSKKLSDSEYIELIKIFGAITTVTKDKDNKYKITIQDNKDYVRTINTSSKELQKLLGSLIDYTDSDITTYQTADKTVKVPEKYFTQKDGKYHLDFSKIDDKTNVYLQKAIEECGEVVDLDTLKDRINKAIDFLVDDFINGRLDETTLNERIAQLGLEVESPLQNAEYNTDANAANNDRFDSKGNPIDYYFEVKDMNGNDVCMRCRIDEFGKNSADGKRSEDVYTVEDLVNAHLATYDENTNSYKLENCNFLHNLVGYANQPEKNLYTADKFPDGVEDLAGLRAFIEIAEKIELVEYKNETKFQDAFGKENLETQMEKITDVLDSLFKEYEESKNADLWAKLKENAIQAVVNKYATDNAYLNTSVTELINYYISQIYKVVEASKTTKNVYVTNTTQTFIEDLDIPSILAKAGKNGTHLTDDNNKKIEYSDSCKFDDFRGSGNAIVNEVGKTLNALKDAIKKQLSGLLGTDFDANVYNKTFDELVTDYKNTYGKTSADNAPSVKEVVDKFIEELLCKESTYGDLYSQKKAAEDGKLLAAATIEELNNYRSFYEMSKAKLSQITLDVNEVIGETDLKTRIGSYVVNELHIKSDTFENMYSKAIEETVKYFKDLVTKSESTIITGKVIAEKFISILNTKVQTKVKDRKQALITSAGVNTLSGYQSKSVTVDANHSAEAWVEEIITANKDTNGNDKLCDNLYKFVSTSYNMTISKDEWTNLYNDVINECKTKFNDAETLSYKEVIDTFLDLLNEKLNSGKLEFKSPEYKPGTKNSEGSNGTNALDNIKGDEKTTKYGDPTAVKNAVQKYLSNNRSKLLAAAKEQNVSESLFNTWWNYAESGILALVVKHFTDANNWEFSENDVLKQAVSIIKEKIANRTDLLTEENIKEINETIKNETITKLKKGDYGYKFTEGYTIYNNIVSAVDKVFTDNANLYKDYLNKSIEEYKQKIEELLKTAIDTFIKDNGINASCNNIINTLKENKDSITSNTKSNIKTAITNWSIDWSNSAGGNPKMVYEALWDQISYTLTGKFTDSMTSDKCKDYFKQAWTEATELVDIKNLDELLTKVLDKFIEMIENPHEYEEPDYKEKFVINLMNYINDNLNSDNLYNQLICNTYYNEPCINNTHPVYPATIDNNGFLLCNKSNGNKDMDSSQLLNNLYWYLRNNIIANMPFGNTLLEKIGGEAILKKLVVNLFNSFVGSGANMPVNKNDFMSIILNDILPTNSDTEFRSYLDGVIEE